MMNIREGALIATDTEIMRIGDEAVRLLRAKNPMLCPEKLGFLNPGYYNYHLLSGGLGLYTTLESANQRLQDSLHETTRRQKVILGFSSVSGGGRDAGNAAMDKLASGKIFGVITSTSRPPRIDSQTGKIIERDGHDYHFFPDNDAFLQAHARGEFLEISQKMDYWYGLSVLKLREALAGNTPVIRLPLDMNAWPIVSEFLKHEYPDQQSSPAFIKVLVIPYMQARYYLEDYLRIKRPSDYLRRRIRSGFELAIAPKLDRADFILLNHFESSGVALEVEAKALLNQIRGILKPSVDFPQFNLSTFGPVPTRGVRVLQEYRLPSR